MVQLPFKNDTTPLGNSLQTATKRFIALETKLQRDPALKNSYSDFIHEYLALDHMERVPGSQIETASSCSNQRTHNQYKNTRSFRRIRQNNKWY
jgi:hypothetical protein